MLYRDTLFPNFLSSHTLEIISPFHCLYPIYFFVHISFALHVRSTYNRFPLDPSVQVLLVVPFPFPVVLQFCFWSFGAHMSIILPLLHGSRIRFIVSLP
ncbi:hypothetical protein BDP27DRAFT_823267 [Rhodocollybia butyracea]|uniref:Uncharacterized protein n=1 Tax=Rhodocollybia butyracea TaxID=206335 RepID=A0A9P5PM49_9AGAR|nr:hypothetical protein BDP27DRAFT_823267 [Rhodocollybia butyracea]